MLVVQVWISGTRYIVASVRELDGAVAIPRMLVTGCKLRRLIPGRLSTVVATWGWLGYLLRNLVSEVNACGQTTGSPELEL